MTQITDKLGGTVDVDTRPEVALLTRNIKFKGEDPVNSEDADHGAHIYIVGSDINMVHARIENIELTEVGQAGQVGRYPIYFKNVGVQNESSFL